MKKVTWFLEDELPTHIKQLNAEHQPKWGKMNAHQMVEHLILITKVSNGEIESDVFAPEEMIAKGKRHVFQYKNPFPKDLRSPVTPEEPADPAFPDLETAKVAFHKELTQFFNHFEGQPDKTVNHPLLGPLTFEEWAFFHTKHYSHHFAQFGLMEREITPN